MASKTLHKGLLAGCGFVAALAVGNRAQASVTLFDSNGFEAAAGFVPLTSLGGQPVTNSANDRFFTTASGTPAPTATVQTYATAVAAGVLPPANSGTQLAVLNDNGVTTGSLESLPQTFVGTGRGFVPSAAAGTNFVDVNFDLAVASTVANPEFGVIARDETGQFIGELLVDSTGNVSGGDNGATIANPAAFHSYELQLDYTDQTLTLFGTQTGSTALTQLDSTTFFTPATTFGYASLYADSADNAVAATGNGFVDNYQVTAVPEPTCASLALGGAALLAGRRRRRATVSGR